MINIKTVIPEKISGLLALHVSMNYNEEIINFIKTLTPAVWLKNSSCWEIGINYLATLIDWLTFKDDIILDISSPEIQKISETPLSEEEINSLKFSPYKHQIEGINFGLEKNKWLLLDNPGCGKTNQIIGLAETLKKRGKIEHCLIIAGINSLKYNWAKEIKKFSNEDYIVIGEKRKHDGTLNKSPMSISERVKQLKSPISEFFIIMNVESFRNESVIKAISSGPNKIQMIAIDEVHRVLATGRGSAQGNNILKLKADYKVAATGTLLINNPINCWGPLVWTENDHSTLTNFKNQMCVFGGFNNSQIVSYKNLDLLKDELDFCSIRRSKEQLIDLPPKNVNLELLEMNPEHAEFYEAVKKGVKEEVNKVKLTTNNLLALTIRLRQATADPSILTTNNITSTKIERCLELTEELVSSGEKVVILSTFKQPVYKLAELLQKYDPLICTGDQPDFEVSNSIDKFQKDNEHMILIGTLGKCSTGLTLNRASYMIMLDEHWTAAMNTQAQDRIYRLNNTNPAFITILACANTIDEHVHEVAQYKQDLSDFVIDDIENSLSDSLKTEMTNILLNL